MTSQNAIREITFGAAPLPTDLQAYLAAAVYPHPTFAHKKKSVVLVEYVSVHAVSVL